LNDKKRNFIRPTTFDAGEVGKFFAPKGKLIFQLTYES